MIGTDTEDKLIDQPEQRGKAKQLTASQIVEAQKKPVSDVKVDDSSDDRPVQRRQTAQPRNVDGGGKMERKTTYAVNSKVASMKAKAEELKTHQKGGKGHDKDKDCNIFLKLLILVCA